MHVKPHQALLYSAVTAADGYSLCDCVANLAWLVRCK